MAINFIRLRKGIFKGGGAFRYPRERLLNTLPLLLWTEIKDQDIELLDHLNKQLETSVRTPPELIKAYTKLWERFR